MITVDDEKQIILEIADYLGIKAIGFTNILDYSYLNDFFNEREKNNYSNELEETDLNKRLHIKNYFDSCKSIIAVGIPYAEGYKKINVHDKGLLSVVSYGLDYHVKIKNLLTDFVSKIKEYVSFEHRIIVDTSPLLDREICKNAGIGMYGKNSMLISDTYGSFINLGYILTDIEIDCDNIVKNVDICNNCGICINSCPNKAIIKGGVINTKRCVSYLTQTKDYIPLEYRKNMTNHIYGCDACQLACPKNKKVSELISNCDYNELTVDLKEIITISNSDFNKRYGLMSGSWRGRNVWKRNALIAISNLEMKSMFDTVKQELKNPSEIIKIYTAWSLLSLNYEKGSDLLHNIIKYENDNIIHEYKKLLEVCNYVSGYLPDRNINI